MGDDGSEYGYCYSVGAYGVPGIGDGYVAPGPDVENMVEFAYSGGRHGPCGA